MTGYKLLVPLVASLLAGRAGVAQDWITAPSYYTHDASGARARQHTPIGPFYTAPRGDFTRSGTRQTRSSLQFGGSVDHYHTVESWGQPVRPYDEWRFPFRPYSVPYDAWGPPYAGLGFGAYPFPYFPIPPYPSQPPWQPGAGATPWTSPYGPGMSPYPPGGAPLPPGGYPLPPGGNPYYPGMNHPFQPFVPYRGFQPWFDDRYPAFDDRAPFRREPFPTIPEDGATP